MIVVTDGSTWYNTGGFDYEWSPDGKWFTLEFIGNRHDPYSDVRHCQRIGRCNY